MDAFTGTSPALPTDRRASWVGVAKKAFHLTDRGAFYVCYFLLLPFFLTPLWVTRLLPGLDLPFHLAMADLLSKAGVPGSPYLPYYEGSLRIAPYAAHFIGLLGLGKVMPIYLAHKVIMVAYVAGLPLSLAGLLAVCRKSRIPALFAFPLAYNLSLHYGFISFALSLPILFLLLRELVRFGQTERRVFLRWLATAGLAFLLFLCHLQNYLYGLCAGVAFALLAPASFRRRLGGIIALLPSVLGLIYWHSQSPPVPGQPPTTLSHAWNLLLSRRKGDLGARPLTDDLWERLRLIPTHAMRAFHDRIEIKACTGLLIILAAYFLMGLFAWRENQPPTEIGNEKQARYRLATWVVFLGALGAYLALPHHLPQMELMTFFPRFAVLVVLMAILIIPRGLIRFSGILRLLLPIPVLIFGMFYGWQLTRHYQQYRGEVKDFLAVMEKAPPGLKALGLVFDRTSRVMNIESTLLGLPSLYPVLKPAPGSMGLASYCGLRHMPCRKTALGETFTDPWVPSSFAPASMLPIFDLMFVRSRPPNHDLFGSHASAVKLLAKEGTWELYRKK